MGVAWKLCTHVRTYVRVCVCAAVLWWLISSGPLCLNGVCLAKRDSSLEFLNRISKMVTSIFLMLAREEDFGVDREGNKDRPMYE